jgi:CRP/FNR family cyclic AMP-dependent transcriptional regulator
MACDLEILRHVPLFALLDDEELAVLAEQVELQNFKARQRIYRLNDPAGYAYVVVSGAVQVTTIDDDHQDVVVAEPGIGEFFGFASMLEQTPHQTNAESEIRELAQKINRLNDSISDIDDLLRGRPGLVAP